MSSNEPRHEGPQKEYNFLRGHPNATLLPLPEIQALFQKIVSTATLTADTTTNTEPNRTYESSANHSLLSTSLNYAHDQGEPACREALQAFLARHTQQDAHPPRDVIAATTTSHELFLTHGVSHGLELLCAAHTQPGDVVWMERPTYFLAANIFRSHSLQIQALPMVRQRQQPDHQQQQQQQQQQPGGWVDVDALERSLQQLQHQENSDNQTKRKRPRLVYIIPTHQNPTGDTMPLADRVKLAQLAEQYNFLVVADEVYHLLDWRQKEQDDEHHNPASMTPRPCRMSLLSHTHCVSVSSFTKIFCPGIRLGWIEASREIIQGIVQLGYIQSQGGCAPLIGELMRIAMSDHICDAVLSKLRQQYKERSALLCGILQKEPGICIHTIPLGGFFVWISFDGIDDAADLVPFAQARGVKFLLGYRCGSILDHEKDSEEESQQDWEMKWCRRSVRLCFADMDLIDIQGGAVQLVESYRDFKGTR